MRNRFPEGGKAIVISQWVFWYNTILCHVQIILGKKFIIGFLKIDNYVALFEGFFFLYIYHKRKIQSFQFTKEVGSAQLLCIGILAAITTAL